MFSSLDDRPNAARFDILWRAWIVASNGYPDELPHAIGALSVLRPPTTAALRDADRKHDALRVRSN